MDILSILDMVNNIGELKRAGEEAFQPMKEGIANTFGYTNPDGTIDEEAYSKARENFAGTAASLAKMPEIEPGVIAPSQVYSSPAPVMGQAPNPYGPSNYGTMQYQPQQMGGIGSAPSMEEILKALQSRGQ